MDLKIGDNVVTNHNYNAFFGYSRSGIVENVQYTEYVIVKCDDNILRTINIDWLEKVCV